MQPKHEHRIAIGAIMKNEAPYIVEWVAWNRLLGFSCIIGDNGGSDGQSELLMRLDRAGVITRLDVRPFRFKPQVPAYNLILRYAAEAGIDILGFIDADEFVEPIGVGEIAGAGARLVGEMMARDGKPALAFNWMCFGSSNLKDAGPEPVLERFTWSMAKDHITNRHTKSFLKVGPTLQLLQTTGATKLHPHGPVLAAEHYSHDGGPLVMPGEFGVTEAVSWRHGRVRHYVTKTWPEFLRGKDARGRPDSKPGDLSYKNDFFARHDVNDVETPLPAAWLQRLKQEMAKIEAALRDVPQPEQVRAPSLGQAMAVHWRGRPFNGPGRGEAFDKGLRQAAQSLRITYLGG